MDHIATPVYTANINKIDLGGLNGEEITISNGNASALLGVNTITLFQDSVNSFVELKSTDTSSGTTSYLTLGVQQFSLSIASQLAMTIGSGSTDPVVFRRNISCTTNTASINPVGLLENSVLHTTTFGTTTLTIANAFATIINTPSAGTRIFVLPAPTVPTVGFWYAICNKSTAFTIAVHDSSGTTIATIPVAPSVTNGGSVARFAVQAGGGLYFRVS